VLILDTDILSIIQLREGSLYEKVVAGLDAQRTETCVTVISFEEQLRGWLALIAKSKQTSRQLVAYRHLLELLDDFRTRRVLPFDEKSARLYEQLRQMHRRLGAMDLKLAAIALAHHAVLTTRNVKEFPGYRWTRRG
jgi:tRNA(fMet)-specific endonuclease VapC